jgi:hypothetical protein
MKMRLQRFHRSMPRLPTFDQDGPFPLETPCGVVKLQVTDIVTWGTRFVVESLNTEASLLK